MEKIIIFQSKTKVFRVKILLKSKNAETFLSYLQQINVINEVTCNHIKNYDGVFTCTLRDNEDKTVDKIAKKAKKLRLQELLSCEIEM